jgi:isoleucyl-tRNA synthetase
MYPEAAPVWEGIPHGCNISGGNRVKEVTSSFDAHRIEGSVQEFWRTAGIYGKVKALHSGDPPFFFVDGPPYTTGQIHLGTAWNKILKDSLLRHRRMKGRNVIARAGYDMHGLPIEVRVEQELGFSSKKEIESYGIGKFISRCREFAAKNMELMSVQFERLGAWLDFDDPYQTMAPEYIEAAWWTCRKAADGNMLEKGFRVVNWCPRCATAIADAEVEYWDETDPSIIVKFPVAGKKDEYLVIWTTTPWTLPANVAVAVHPDFTYARVLAVKGERDEILWIAKDLVEPVLRKGRYQDYSITETRQGRELIGMVYSSPLHEQVPIQREISHRVVAADFVTGENTGLVHIAPGHGWDDYLLGQRENLAIFCPVDATGTFTKEAGVLECLFVRDANRVVMDELAGHLLSEETVSHRYGHCWRCKTPIIFRATEQWFLKVSGIRDRMIEEASAVAWYPDWAGSARFHDWIREARDWCISRQRYWGIPIPIWVCDRCELLRVIGTIAELEEASGTPVPDPHRPYVDEIVIPCACGGTMHRVEDIFDVWFDSGVASWATLRFPREKEAFSRLWPADLIAEGQDQTRGWFYSQLGASTIAFDRSPYRAVLMHGFALDAEGRKMSKSLGNVVSPEEVIDKVGVDVLRLYVLSQSAPWDDLKFNWDGVRTVNRSVNIFWNVYRFPLPYMILDGFVPAGSASGWDGGWIREWYTQLPALDRWLLSRMQTLITEVDSAMEGCQFHRATRAILQFILDDLSRWYVQLVRPRMWLEEESLSKEKAYETIYYVIRRLSQLMAPFAPHLSEEIYRNLRHEREPESVHMLGWPVPDPLLADARLERAMAFIFAFDEAQANARQAGKRKLRWPVRECVVATASEELAQAVEELGEICRERANARIVTVVRGEWDRIGWKAEPVMKALGPAFGRKAGRIRELISTEDGALLKKTLASEGKAVLRDGGTEYEIGPESVIFSEELPAGVFSAPMEGGRVYVDTTLTPELESEGYSREIIRRIQDMRRKAALRVDDNIHVQFATNVQKVVNYFQDCKPIIADEVRAKSMEVASWSDLTPTHTLTEPPHIALSSEASKREVTEEWEVEGIGIRLSILRA